MQRLIIALAAVINASAYGADAFRPEAHLPGGTLVYASVPLSRAWMERFRETAPYKIWNQPEVQRFLKEPVARMEANFDLWLKVSGEEAGLELRPFLDVVPDRVVLGVPGWDREKEEPTAAFLAADFSDRAGKAREAVARMIDLGREKEKFSEVKEEEFEGTKLLRVIFKEGDGATGEIRLPDGKVIGIGGGKKGEKDEPSPVVLEYAFLGTWLLAEIGGGKVDLKARLKPAGSLAENAAFQKAASRLKHDGSEPFIFVDVAAILDLIPDSVKEAKDEDEVAVWPILEATGLTKIRSVAYTQRLDGPAIVDHMYLDVPAPRTGILAALEGACTPGTMARFFPEGAHAYGESFLDLSALWSSVDRIIAACPKEVQEPYREGVEMIEKKIGAKVADELLPCFGKALASYSTMPATLGGGSMLGEGGYAFPLKDAAKLREIIEKIKALPEVKEALVIAEETYEGVPTTTITIRNVFLPLMPAYAVLDDVMLLAGDRVSLRKMVDVYKTKAPSLAEDEAFRAHRSRAFPEGAMAGMYMDLGAFVRGLYTIAVPILNLSIAAEPRALQELRKRGYDLSLLPSADALSAPLFPGTESVVADPGGFEYLGRSPFGGGAIGIYKLAALVFAAVAVNEGMLASLQAHDEKICRKNMEKIGEALAVYRTTIGGGNPPRDLPALLRYDLIDGPGVLRCPADEKPESISDPATGRRVEVSYRYVPENFADPERRRIVVYEAHEGHPSSRIAVLYNDGKVESVFGKARLDELLQEKPASPGTPGEVKEGK